MTETPERPAETRVTEVDDLLDAFQRVCEDVTVANERGAPRAGYEKERAILRNALRARLLAEATSATMSVERAAQIVEAAKDAVGQKCGQNLDAMLLDYRRLRASSLGEPVSQEAPWVVWSHERNAWWRANRQGYAGSLFGAGVYSEDEAKAIEDDSHRGDVARLLVDEFERQSRVVGTGANWLRTQLAASRVEAKPQNPCVVFGCECPECSGPREGQRCS